MVFIDSKALKPNMVLGREIQKGDVLLERGTLLTEPLITSLRKTGIPGVDVDRFPERIIRERRRPASELKPGMEVTRHVTDMSGRIVFRRGSILTQEDIDEIVRWMIKKIWVKHETFTRAGVLAAEQDDRLQRAYRRGVMVYRSELSSNPPYVQISLFSAGLIALILAESGISITVAAAIVGLMLVGLFLAVVAFTTRSPPEESYALAVNTMGRQGPSAVETGPAHVCPHCGATTKIPPVECQACGKPIELGEPVTPIKPASPAAGARTL